MNSIRNNLVFSVLSGILLSIPWLVPHTGVILFFAFIPLLWMEHAFTTSGKKGCWIYYGLTFLIWNACTVFWISFVSVIPGILAVIGNAAQMFIIFAIFRRVKRWFLRKGKPDLFAYLFLLTFWIAWEYFYFDAEISFPWLVLGNGFATNLRLVQWYEWTGVLGGSLWVFTSNLLIFYILRGVRSKSLSVVLALWIFVPVTWSIIRFYTYKEKPDPVEVVIVQPNIDPVHEKFHNMPQEEQDRRILGIASEWVTSSTNYVVAPETSIPSVVEGQYFDSESMRKYKDFVLDHPHIAFIFGANTYGFYPYSPVKPSPSARPYKDSWYEVYNTAIQLDTTERVQVYHKSKLVVGGEKMPFIDVFPFIEKLSLNLGGTTGTLGSQPDRTVFTRPGSRAKTGVAICYESIYGAFVTEYVKNGANFLTVITNDGWWGDTPGYRQHVSYASLRAIETRRSIVQSANTGISAFINQRGEREQQTKWWIQTGLRGEINLNEKLTFYVKNGDYPGRIFTWVFLLLSVYSLIIAFPSRKRG